MSPRLLPIDFLKIWGARVPYLTVGKIWKKYWEGEWGLAWAYQVSLPYIEPIPFPQTFDKFVEKFSGGPRSPAPVPKNLEKINSVGIKVVLNLTEFRDLPLHFNWVIQLSTFWEFPLFSKSVKLIFPENRRKKSRFRLCINTSWFNLLWLAGILGWFTSACSLEVLGGFGYILGSQFLKIPQKSNNGGKKCKLMRPIEVGE